MKKSCKLERSSKKLAVAHALAAAEDGGTRPGDLEIDAPLKALRGWHLWSRVVPALLATALLVLGCAASLQARNAVGRLPWLLRAGRQAAATTVARAAGQPPSSRLHSPVAGPLAGGLSTAGAPKAATVEEPRSVVPAVVSSRAASPTRASTQTSPSSARSKRLAKDTAQALPEEVVWCTESGERTAGPSAQRSHPPTALPISWLDFVFAIALNYLGLTVRWLDCLCNIYCIERTGPDRAQACASPVLRSSRTAGAGSMHRRRQAPAKRYCGHGRRSVRS